MADRLKLDSVGSDILLLAPAGDGLLLSAPPVEVWNPLYSYAVDDSYDVDVNWTKDGSWWGESTADACTTGSATPPDGHTNYISSAKSPDTGTREIYRDIDVSSHSTEIDAGGVDFQALVDIASYAGDTGHLAIEFYDVTPAIIGSRTSGSALDPGCTWTEQELTGDVPVNTRTIRVILVATYGAGSYNNAYFSNPRVNLKGADIGDEVRATTVDVPFVTERTADEEVRFTQLVVQAATERPADESEVRFTQMRVEAVIDRTSVINHNIPTSIVCFA